jgi:dinuclear metal center YbgI/SA1388 family protein
MKLQALVDVFERIAPRRYAESWDNVGLLVGDPDADVARCLLAIDCTREVFDEARAQGCACVIAYHPVIFEGLKRLDARSVVYRAAREGVAIWSPHTALDVADGGTNDVLADIVGLRDRTPLRITRVDEAKGLGRVGDVAPIERAALLDEIKRGLGVERLLVAGRTEGTVTRVAVGAGACGDLIKEVLASRAGLYLTGEMRHHDALRAASAGVTVVCALHSNSERVTLRRLAATLATQAPAVTFVLSERDRDPFAVL